MRTRRFTDLAHTAPFSSLLWVFGAWLVVPSLIAATPAPAGLNPRVAAALEYISSSWAVLTRSMSECKTVYDPKSPGGSTLYFPTDFPIPAPIANLKRSCPVDIRHLPHVIHHLGQGEVSKVHPQGLLYLPHSYVVPGGMFNEMYGWDSYFILRGLLKAGRLNLARGMVENFFFEIGHYGAILNANRTYHMTRSQPPFLSEMVRAVYDAEQARGENGRAWLREAYPFVARTEEFWTHAPNLAGSTGLSRYFDLGQGPAPELGSSSDDYYRQVASYFLTHPASAGGYLIWTRPKHQASAPVGSPVGPLFPAYLCNPSGHSAAQGLPRAGCARAGSAALSRAFYKGDRSLRESGFDITFKFGPFGAGTPDYAPVGLNSLLYREETDLEWMSRRLGKSADAAKWRARADQRRHEITTYFWNPERGLFFDYNFKAGAQSDYVYATTFYPLWVGAASAGQAQATVGNLPIFDEPGGIVMSRETTGGQWDYPYGWAPLQLIAVEALRRYGDNTDANLVSARFLSMLTDNFARDHTLYEKYNVVTRSSETRVRVGYTKNQVGFGWTNGVFVTLFDDLPASWRARLGQSRELIGASATAK
ncbi:MAG: trehalase family glycosidase [Terriglobia bacterium]